MKKLKDIFYDMNDVLVALIIVAVAGFVISVNIDSILAYPSQVAAEIQLPEEETPINYAENPPIVDPGSETTDQPETPDGETSGNDSETQGQNGDGTQGTDNQQGGSTQGNAGGGAQGNPGTGEVVNHSVYIAPGSTGEQIADIMVSIGLFNSRQEFVNAAKAAGAESKLKAGTFIIPSNATPSEVISIITR